jgi:ketose-bisphosphate aldolase
VLGSLSDVLAQGKAAGAGVGAFTCYDLVAGSAVVSAAGELDAPVVLLVSARALDRPGGEALVAGLGQLARSAPGTVCLQLDHVRPGSPLADETLAWCSAVMLDASSLPFDENLAATAAAARRWRGSVEVEGELGCLAGDEDVASGELGSEMTDPAAAAEFCRESGVSCLAVAVGNAHGPYAEEPKLDLGRLGDIVDRCQVPIALHGASGLPDDDLRRAVAAGARKVNVNADLRTAWFATLGARLQSYAGSLDVLGLQDEVGRSMASVVTEKLAVLGWAGHAPD